MVNLDVFSVIVYVLFVVLIIIFDVILNYDLRHGKYTQEHQYILYTVERTKDGTYVPRMTVWNWLLQFVVVLMIVVAGLFIWYTIHTRKMSNLGIDGVDQLRKRANTIQLDRPTIESASRNYQPRQSSSV